MLRTALLLAVPSVFVVLLAACGEKQEKVDAPVAAAPKCPEGSDWNGQSCAGRVVTCPEGLRFEQGTGCVADPLGQKAAAVASRGGEPPIDPPARGATFPQAFEQKSGLLRIHYPSDLTVQADSDNLTFLDPAAASSVSQKSLVTFTTNPDPISQNPDEYAAVLQGARAKVLTGYALLSTTPGRCFRNVRGVETRWEYTEGQTSMRGRACAFVHHHHGYSFMYAFDPQRPKDEVYLRSVIEAVEVTD